MVRDRITALKLSLFVLSIVLFLFMSFSAWRLLTATSMELLSYLNIASKHPMQEILPLDITLLRLNGGMHGIAALILLISIIKLDIFSNKDCFQMLKWGLFVTLFSFVLLGSIFRIISNEQGAALFFLPVVLYTYFYVGSILSKAFIRMVYGTISCTYQFI